MSRPKNIITIQWLLDRAKHNPTTGCIEWLYGTNGKGYGEVCENYIQILAHRKMYELCCSVTLKTTDIVRHDCDNPLCINIEHLTLGTYLQNSQDCINRGRLRTNKLNKDDILCIRAMREDCYTYKAIAEEFDVAPSTIRDILLGFNWKHVP